MIWILGFSNLRCYHLPALLRRLFKELQLIINCPKTFQMHSAEQMSVQTELMQNSKVLHVAITATRSKTTTEWVPPLAVLKEIQPRDCRSLSLNKANPPSRVVRILQSSQFRDMSHLGRLPRVIIRSPTSQVSNVIALQIIIFSSTKKKKIHYFRLLILSLLYILFFEK